MELARSTSSTDNHPLITIENRPAAGGSMESWLKDIQTACTPEGSSSSTERRNVKEAIETSAKINTLLLDFRADLIENRAQVIGEFCRRFYNLLRNLLEDAAMVSIAG
jgi:hypothetical protein